MSVLMFNFDVMVWEIFAIIAVFLIVSEIFVSGFFMLPIGLAFAIAAIPAAIVDSWLIVLATLAASLLFLFWLFHMKLKSVKEKTSAYTNVEGMVGKEVEVTEAFSGNESGYVKLYGDRWQAISQSGKSYSVGDRVSVVKIDGNKLIVE